VQIVTPNPKTSGGARWNYLAAWAYALHTRNGKDETRSRRNIVGDLYRNVPGPRHGCARLAVTFASASIGDVLLAWENEAYLAGAEFGAMTNSRSSLPPISILAEPPVTVVDGNVDAKGTRKQAEAYLNYLYSEEGQNIAAKHFYRPLEARGGQAELLQQLPDIKLVTIDDPIFGGWVKAQPEHFGDGGVFDQIYKPGN
jgi:sulfate/thiosulfate-binding protein